MPFDLIAATTATKIVTTPASPLWTVVATIGTLAGVGVAFLAYRLTRRQARADSIAQEQAKKDAADALERQRQEQMTKVVQTLDGLHGAFWGRMEGTTKIPGMAEVVSGDGNGNKDLRTVTNQITARLGDMEQRQVVIAETVDEARINAAKAVEVAAKVAANAERFHEDSLRQISEHLADDTDRFATVDGRLGEILTVAQEAVHGVETINGLTLGQLAERIEGRDIMANTTPSTRSPQQQAYVEAAADQEMGPDDSPRST